MSDHLGVPLIWHIPAFIGFTIDIYYFPFGRGKPEFMATNSFPIHSICVPQVGQFRPPPKRNDLVAGRNIFKEICMCPSCFSLMFRNSDVIRKFLFPCRICFLLGFIKKIQLTIDIFPFFTGSTKELLREIFNLLTKVFFFQRSASNVFCKDWISSVCVEIVLFSWLIRSLYARIFESFELPAIVFAPFSLLLLYHKKQ